MSNQNRPIAVLLAALVASVALALSLASASAGPAYSNYLPPVRKSQPSATHFDSDHDGTGCEA